MSAALGLLRRHFGDDLLARKGSGYELTALGKVLLDRTQVACEMLDLVSAANRASTPRASTASSPSSPPTTQSW